MKGLQRNYLPVIVEVEESDYADSVFEALEAVVYHHRGGLYLTSIPEDKLSDLPRFRSVDGLYIARPLNLTMDVARAECKVDCVHEGTESYGPYTGKGVVTGICDVGFDPRHGAFDNRIGRWIIYDEYHGQKKVYDNLDDAPLTDNEEMTHATHVGNILAGYYEGSPYNGVAPGSIFVPTMSGLSDVGILAGIEDIIDYAKSIGAPAVVNISAGSYLGPHDGRDMVGRYLTELSKDAVICFSAGNYGTRSNCLALNLDDYMTPPGSAFCDTGWVGYDVVGATDFWSSDDKPFEVRLRVMDIMTKQDVYVSDWFGKSGNGAEYNIPLDSLGIFEEGSYVWLGWELYPANNRFNLTVEYDYHTTVSDGQNPWARYFVAFNVRKVQPETRVMVYADGVLSFLHVNGGLKGNSDGSISNLACCPDVVAVGGYQTRSVVPDIGFGQVDHNITTGCVGKWSAFGTSGDGRRLPHFAAPGNILVSALSAPYFNCHPEAQRVCYELNGNRWYAEGGTSMASPIVAGIFAMWLEADPTLSVYELREIAELTATKDFDDIDDPRWGAGAINAMAGLKEVELRNVEESVNDISLGNDLLPHIAMVNGSIEVYWPGVTDPQVKVYSLSGMEILNSNLNTDGLYIVRVTDIRTGRTVTRKIIHS